MTIPHMPGSKVFAAVCMIGGCETLGCLFLSWFSAISVLAAVRTGQLICLYLLLIHPGKNFYFQGGICAGLKKGVVWSFFFGTGVCLAGLAMMATGFDPIAAIRPFSPETAPFLFFLTAVVLGPIAEELFFRGVLYTYLRSLGIWVAIILSTAVFALFHYSGNGLPLTQIVGGILFAGAFESTKNLITPIILHVLGNLAIHAVAWTAAL